MTDPKDDKQKSPPWYMFAKSNEGKRETDPSFNKAMSSKWKLFGLGFTSIIGSTRAWCGLAMAVSLAAVSMQYQKGGESAIAWDQFGVSIPWKSDGIPQGAIIRLNHKGDCRSEANNHVTQADGYCTADDLLKKDATFNGLGGNQQDTWKVSTYSVREICSVRWPKEYAKPAKVLKSINCTGKKAGAESTR